MKIIENLNICKIFKDLLNFLFPRYCVMCGERLAEGEDYICVSCIRHLPLTRSHLKDDNPIERLFWYQLPVVRATSYAFYEGASFRRMVYKFKYFDSPKLGTFLGRMMAVNLLKDNFFEGIDMIIPVPLSKRKLLKRGYNQCLYLAQGVSEVTGIPIDTTSVIRCVDNLAQASLSHDSQRRQENVEGIFRLCCSENVDGKHVLVIDDIITTGSTILSCCKEIASQGNVRISILSLAYAGEKFL